MTGWLAITGSSEANTKSDKETDEKRIACKATREGSDFMDLSSICRDD